MTAPLFLLDTNICIYLLEGLSDLARDRVQNHAPGEVATSVICYAEIMRGIDHANETAIAITERLFTVIPVLEFGRAAALCYRDIPFRRGSFDRLIAAHALSIGATVITNNEADFADVPRLKVENWTV